MRSVALSEVPCGAATSIPGRPFSSSTRASPSTTVAGARLVLGPGPDQHGLRHRVLAVVGEGEQHLHAALGECDGARAPGERHGGSLTALAPHLELAPV